MTYRIKPLNWIGTYASTIIGTYRVSGGTAGFKFQLQNGARMFISQAFKTEDDAKAGANDNYLTELHKAMEPVE